jgi:hypothetical protein
MTLFREGSKCSKTTKGGLYKVFFVRFVFFGPS